MKLLIISNNTDRSSFKERIAVYLDTLRDNGINCTTEVLPASLLARRKLFKSSREFDGVFLHKKKLSFLDAFFLRRCCKKLIYNFDDAVMYDQNNPSRNSLLRFMPFRRTVRLADMVLVGSRYLAEHALKFNSNVEILPLGLKVNLYNITPPAKTDDKIRLVWIGSESNLKYLEQIKPVIEAVGSRFPNVVLRIIGDTFFDMPNIPVEKLKWSEQTRGLGLVTSDIGLAPLPDDRFTRGKCSFKVLEYAAAGLPVVASPIGTNAEHIRQGVTGFLAENADQWLEKISLLVRTPQLRASMGMQGRQFAQQFDVAVIGKRLAGIIKKCLAGTV
ncbi:MAG: glycosyltransferase family 4 protein [Sedimentisphaerales bacterium]|jgi:glycosyltransferase involved in cell wall biosynthesis